MLRSVSDLPQHNTITYSLEEFIFIGIHGQHMFTVRVLFQRCVDPVHESKPLLLCTKTQRTRSHHKQNCSTYYKVCYGILDLVLPYHCLKYLAVACRFQDKNMAIHTKTILLPSETITLPYTLQASGKCGAM